MAKKSVIARNKQRRAKVAKYATRYAELKKQSHSLDDDVRMEAIAKLQRLPRNALKVRLCNRCEITGRKKGYYRDFGIARNMLRKLAMAGHIPGLRKSSW